MPVRSLVCAVEPFDHLLEGPELFGDLIVVGKSDDLCDAEHKSVAEFPEELLCSERIGAVTVSNETEVLGKFFEMSESHTHGKDAGTDTAVIGHLIADDGTFGGIEDEPDVGLDAADLDISFIGGESTAGTIIVVVNERLDTDSSGLTVVGYLLVGDGDVIEVFECLRGLAQGQAQVHMQGQAQGHDM